jgi:nitrite reductase (NADH) small subunit
MAGQVRICLGRKIPKEGQVREVRVGQCEFCVAKVNGAISVVDGLCSHKDLPLGEGSIEKGRVVCPWHGWEFYLETGEQHHGKARVRVYEAVVEDGELLVTIS